MLLIGGAQLQSGADVNKPLAVFLRRVRRLDDAHKWPACDLLRGAEL